MKKQDLDALLTIIEFKEKSIDYSDALTELKEAVSTNDIANSEERLTMLRQIYNQLGLSDLYKKLRIVSRQLSCPV